ALWALDDFKAAQAADVQRGDWTLAPAKDPGEALRSAGAAANDLAAALEAFDPDRADRAATALFRAAGAEGFFDVVWTYAARSFADAGHRIIHSAQVERTVRRVDPVCAEAALRTIAIGLADDADGPPTKSFADAKELARELPERWLEGAE